MADDFNPAEFQQYKNTVEPPEPGSPAPPTPSGPAPEFDPAEFAAFKPQGEPQEGGSHFRHGVGVATGALHDVAVGAPQAAWESLKGSGRTIASDLNPFSEQRQQGSVLQNTLNTGKGILAAITAVPSAVGAAASAAAGPTYGEAVHGVGRLIAPQTAAQDNPEQLHQMGQEAVGTALQGIRAAGEVAPTPSGQLAFQPKPSAPQPPRVPTWQEAQTAAEQNFRNAEGYGIELHDKATNRLADDVKTALENGNKRDYKEQSTFKLVDELRKPPGQNSTIGDIWSVRQALGDVPISERPAARIAQREIDDYLRNRINPNDAAINGHFVQRAGPELKEGIDNYAIAKHGERLDQMQESAERTQARRGTPAEQTLRTKLQAVLDNKNRQRGWTKDDLAAADAVVRGSPIAEAPRRILQKVGFPSHYIPFAKAAADLTSNVSTAGRAEVLRKQIMMRSPLYQKALAQHKAGLSPPGPTTPSPPATAASVLAQPNKLPRKPPIAQPQITSSEEEPQPHAAGGVVKLPHKAVSYGKGHGVQFCHTCKFSDHKPRPTCQWVVDITRDGWCTLWKR